MSIRVSALREEIDIFLRVASGTDEFNNTIYADSAPTTVPAAVVPVGAAGGVGSSDEIDVGDRDTRISRYMVTVAPDVVLNGLARVEWRGRSFEVVGEPREFVTNGSSHHFEFTIREVLG